MKIVVLTALLAMLSGGLMADREKDLQPAGSWASFPGCVKSCSDFLGCGYSADWIYGVSGYAFIINMFPGTCPSGPTAFENQFLRDNLESLGLRFEAVNSWKGSPDFAEAQQQAFQLAKTTLARGNPAFGWALGILEYYPIKGTDAENYFYADFDGSTQKCRWDSLGTGSDIMLEVYGLSAVKPEADVLDQARQALKFVAEYHADPQKYALAGYTQGPAAYDVWTESLHQGDFDPFGLAYNARVWCEARERARGFLLELKQQLGNERDLSSLDKAAESFGAVAAALEGICGLYRFPPQGEDFTPEHADKAAALLNQAKLAELEGVEQLRQFASKL